MNTAMRAPHRSFRHRPARSVELATAILAVSGLSGCVSMAPAYRAPEPAVAAMYAPQEPVSGMRDDIPAWHDYFTDPQMQSLISQALRANRDLRMTVLRVEEARALYGVRRSDRFPVIGLQASLDRARVPGDLNLTGQPIVSSQYQAGLGVSTWEIDFCGRVRSLQDAALEQFLATAKRAGRPRWLLALAGPMVSKVIGALEGTVAVGGVGAIGVALTDLGAHKDQVATYETALKADHYLLPVHGDEQDRSLLADSILASQPVAA